MNDLGPVQAAYWERYLAQLSDQDRAEVGDVVADQPGSPDISDQLVDLYLAGRKTAGSGLVEDYLTAGDPLPRPGDHWIALGGDGRPRCILRVDRVETHAFRDVPERIARAEGEGDLSLAYWRRVHAAHFGPYLDQWGVADLEDATVVTEFFTVVYRAPADENQPGEGGTGA